MNARYRPSSKCPWCLNPNADDADNDESLCLTHRAEYYGTTVDDLQRGESEQYAEWADTLG